MATYLRKRGKKYHFRKRIPQYFQSLFEQDVIQVALKTDSLVVAKQRACNFDLALEEFFKTLDGINQQSAQRQLNDICLKAKMFGFQYKNKKEIVTQVSTQEFVNRVNVASLATDVKTSEAILGGTTKAGINLSYALEEFFEYEAGNLSGLSDYQIKKWKNSRKSALNNFIKIVGDKPLHEITRKDILDFRSWWVDQVNATPPKSPNTANKQFGFVRKIIATGVNNHMLDMSVENLFKQISLKDVDKKSRHPFELKFIKDVLLNPSKIDLNREAHLFIYAMSDTGARIGELLGLQEDEIILSGNVPHIKIRPNNIRNLKTPQSERDIPLVGASLYAFKELQGTFKRYQGKPDLLSNTINKYFRENDILPSKAHSLYSLRHSFEDRLTAVEPPDKLQAALMGHKYHRPRYGHGPTLEQKKIWLEKIAIK